jgi:phage gpG-like protein
LKITVKTNFKKVFDDLKKKDQQAMLLVEQGMVRGMELFSSRIIMKQMTGRPGLNVQTGNLRRSWVVRKTRTKDDIAVSLGTQTKYARIHQYGGIIKNPGTNNGFGRGIKIPAYDIRMPKRLFVLEDFQKTGLGIISKQIARGLHKAYSK